MRKALVIAAAGVTVGVVVLWRMSASTEPATPAAPPAKVVASATARPGLPSAAPRTKGYAPFDCARPAGEAARVDGESLALGELCARLVRLGAVTPQGADRQQARHVLDRMIDVHIVRRALAQKRLAVSDADVAAAMGALPPSLGADLQLVTEQLRERLELKKLVGDRAAVSERDVDAEVATARDAQALRVEGFLARVAPAADAAAQEAAKERAERFATAVRRGMPERHGLTPIAPFVVGESGIELELEAAAGALREGAWSGAVRTRVGWAVIRVVGTVKGVARDRATARRAVETRKLQAAQQRVLEELRAAARIEYLVDV